MRPLADMRRQPWTALYLALAGLLCQALFAVPASTLMAVEHTGGFGQIICTSEGAQRSGDVAGHGEQTKRHICDVCVAAAATAVAAVVPGLVLPKGTPGTAVVPPRAFLLPSRSASGYLSRAPPLLG